MSRHWFRPGFWAREERAFVGLIGGRRPLWRLTVRELATHAALLVLNVALLSVAWFAVFWLSARLPQPFGALVAALGSIGVWAYIIAAVRGRLPKLTIRHRSTQRAIGCGRPPCSPPAVSRPRSSR